MKEGMLVARGNCWDRRKVLLDLTPGNKESLDAWLAMVRDMVRCGLQVPTLITTDGAPGLIAAVEQAWPRSLRQRCLAHKKRNILDKVPDSAREEVKAALNGIYYADTPRGRPADHALSGDLWPALPVRGRLLHQRPGGLPGFSQVPVDPSQPYPYHQPAGTRLSGAAATGEHSPRFFDKRCCLKLVFAMFWQANERWQNVRISDVECALLDRLRRKLGL